MPISACRNTVAKKHKWRKKSISFQQLLGSLAVNSPTVILLPQVRSKPDWVARATRLCRRATGPTESEGGRYQGAAPMNLSRRRHSGRQAADRHRQVACATQWLCRRNHRDAFLNRCGSFLDGSGTFPSRRDAAATVAETSSAIAETSPAVAEVFSTAQKTSPMIAETVSIIAETSSAVGELSSVVQETSSTVKETISISAETVATTEKALKTIENPSKPIKTAKNNQTDPRPQTPEPKP